MNENQEKGIMEHTTFERVGDTIHRERLMKTITVEKIAADLKLNADYIRGIEESEYGKLPAVAYTRVYIKSIASYLSLDAEELLERFSRELNIETHDAERDRRDTLSVKVQGSKKPNPFLPLIYIIIVLVLVILLIKQGRRDETDKSAFDVTGQDTVKIDIPSDTGEDLSDSLPKGVSAQLDSLTDTTKVPLPAGDSAVDNSKNTKFDSAKDAAKDSTAQKKMLNFKVYGKKDSSWVKVYADGKKVFDGVVSVSKSVTFSAKESLNVLVGKNANVQYKLNGSSLNIDGTGSKILKVTDTKIELWKKSQWNAAFGAN